MDELHNLQYSADFSTDVNRKMQIPTRLSMEPEEAFLLDSPTQKTKVDIEGSPAHAMNVPDRILIAGSDQHVGLREAPRDLDLTNVAPYPPDVNVGLTTPPRTLTLDEFSFPTAGDPRKSAVKGGAPNNVVRPSDVSSSGVVTANSSMVESPQSIDLDKLQRRVLLLTSKVAKLEEERNRRERREQIFMVVGIAYMVFKGLRFLFRSPYP